MPARTLTVVLPAYNEEARIGPALDELFGWLRGPGREALPLRTPRYRGRPAGLGGLPGPPAWMADLVRQRGVTSKS